MMAAVPYIHNVGKQVQKLQNSTLMDRNRWKWYTVQKHRRCDHEHQADTGRTAQRPACGAESELETLAEQTGLSKSALSKYESDDVTDLSIYAVTTLAEFYGVTTDYLLGGDGKTKKTPRCSPFGLASERWRSGRIKEWKIQSSAAV